MIKLTGKERYMMFKWIDENKESIVANTYEECIKKMKKEIGVVAGVPSFSRACRELGIKKIYKQNAIKTYTLDLKIRTLTFAISKLYQELEVDAPDDLVNLYNCFIDGDHVQG